MALMADVGSVFEMFTAGNYAVPLVAAAVAVGGQILKRGGGIDGVLDRIQTHGGTIITNITSVLKTAVGKMVLAFVGLVLLLSTMGYLFIRNYVKPETVLSTETYGPFEVDRFPASAYFMDADGRKCPIVHVHTVVRNITSEEIRVELLQDQTSITDERSGNRMDFGAPLRVGGVPAVTNLRDGSWDNFLSVMPSTGKNTNNHGVSIDLTTSQDPKLNSCLKADQHGPQFDASRTATGRMDATIALKSWGPKQDVVYTTSFPLNNLPSTN